MSFHGCLGCGQRRQCYSIVKLALREEPRSEPGQPFSGRELRPASPRAILAADVVGYSRLVGQDEDGTLAAIRRLRAEVIEPKISEHHGRLFKTTGDGFLSGVPDVVNAVTCAVAVQQAMTSRNARRSGRPQDRTSHLASTSAISSRMVATFYGDGVNIAARIEGLAPPGGVAVSAMVHDNIGSRLDLAFEDMGEQQLKNIARPVRVLPSGDPVSANHADRDHGAHPSRRSLCCPSPT